MSWLIDRRGRREEGNLQASWAAFTFIFAVSWVKGGRGCLGLVKSAIFSFLEVD